MGPDVLLALLLDWLIPTSRERKARRINNSHFGVRRTAEELGLTLTKRLGELRAEGVCDGVSISMENATDSPDLVVVARALGARAEGGVRATGAEPESTGVAALDRVATIRCDEALALAALDAETRAAWVRVNIPIPGATLREGGVVSLKIPQSLAIPERMVAAVTAVAMISRRLTIVASSVPGCLRDNARNDPDAGVRLRSLEVLLRRFPESQEAADAQTAALAGADYALRLAVAVFRRDAEEFVKLVVRQDVSEEFRIRALDEMIPVAPAARDALFAAVLGEGGDAICRAALKTARRAGHRIPSVQLAPLLRSYDDDLVEAAIGALGASGDPAASGVLLGVLETARPGRTNLAIHALARVGGVDTIGRLRAFAVLDPAFAKVVDSAVASIQSRIAGADAGQLSMPAPEEGRLTLSSDAGRVSFPRGEMKKP